MADTHTSTSHYTPYKLLSFWHAYTPKRLYINIHIIHICFDLKAQFWRCSFPFGFHIIIQSLELFKFCIFVSFLFILFLLQNLFIFFLQINLRGSTHSLSLTSRFSLYAFSFRYMGVSDRFFFFLYALSMIEVKCANMTAVNDGAMVFTLIDVCASI